MGIAYRHIEQFKVKCGDINGVGVADEASSCAISSSPLEEDNVAELGLF